MAGHDSTVLLDAEAPAWEGGRAGERVSSLEGIELGAAHSGPVGVDHVAGKEEQASSGIGDGEPAGGVEAGVADLESRGVEAPEAAGVVNGRVLDLSGVLGLVDVPKVVASGSLLHEVDGEQRTGKVVHGVLEESLLLLWLDGVEGAEAESEKTGGSSIGLEGGRNLLSRLNSLSLDSYAANGNDVGVNGAGRCASIAIGDVPGCPLHLSRSGTEVWVVLDLAILLVLRCLVGVHPEVCGAGIKVEVDCLRWCADLDWGLDMNCKQRHFQEGEPFIPNIHGRKPQGSSQRCLQEV